MNGQYYRTMGHVPSFRAQKTQNLRKAQILKVEVLILRLGMFLSYNINNCLIVNPWIYYITMVQLKIIGM